MKQVSILVLTGVIFLFSNCSGENANQAKETKRPGNEQNLYGIELVKNEKWNVKPEMMVHIRNMESDIKSLDHKNTNAYHELGQKLDEHIGLLTSNCTMKGQAHDELHKWLVPFIGIVDELNEASTKEKQLMSYKALTKSFLEFNRYFK